ncbi:Uncharacterised protein [Collinsella intestinalis]|nr:Uncharacterised protein [Collinsella intestinalis]
MVSAWSMRPLTVREPSALSYLDGHLVTISVHLSMGGFSTVPVQMATTPEPKVAGSAPS